MLYGYIRYKITADSYARLFEFILDNNIFCDDLSESRGVLKLKIGVEHRKKLEAFLTENNMEYKITNAGGFVFKLKGLLWHKGLIFGFFVVLILMLVGSNMLMRFEILTDDEEIRNDILSVLEQNGVRAGSFLPTLNMTVLERELKQNVKGISWAGISVNGTTLIIDTVENVDKPEQRHDRMPSNLVAKYDAVIEKVEVLDGQLVTTIGSGVKKGDILISGTVVTDKVHWENAKEIHDIKTTYARSQGKVYGTFQITKTFVQPFEAKVKVSSDEAVTRHYLDVFDLSIPLSFGKLYGSFDEETSTNSLTFFGVNLPVSITNSHLTEYTLETQSISREEASALANETVTKYEHNFLKDYEIKNAKREEKVSNDGIEITATYTLYGDICEEVQFFAKK